MCRARVSAEASVWGVTISAEQPEGGSSGVWVKDWRGKSEAGRPHRVLTTGSEEPDKE